MLKKEQVHIDLSITNTNTLLNGSLQATSFMNNNPFQCKYNLAYRNQFYTSIALKNVQIPIGFYNIRAPFNQLIINSSVYTITPGNYTTLAALNLAKCSILSAGGVTTTGTLTNTIGTFAPDTYTGIVTFSFTAGTGTLTNTPGTSLLTFLGFPKSLSIIGTSAVVGTLPYTLVWDTYLTIWIENIGTSSPENSQVTFKIPLGTQSNGVAYWSEFAQNTQIFRIQDYSRMDHLNITVLDRFGTILNNNGLFWSMTLEFDC